MIVYTHSLIVLFFTFKSVLDVNICKNEKYCEYSHIINVQCLELRFLQSARCFEMTSKSLKYIYILVNLDQQNIYISEFELSNSR